MPNYFQISRMFFDKKIFTVFPINIKMCYNKEKGPAPCGHMFLNGPTKVEPS